MHQHLFKAVFLLIFIFIFFLEIAFTHVPHITRRYLQTGRRKDDFSNIRFVCLHTWPGLLYNKG